MQIRVLVVFLALASMPLTGSTATVSAASPPRSTGTISDARGDSNSDPLIDIVAASAKYSPKKGLVVTIRLAKPFKRGDVLNPAGVSLGAELLASDNDENWKTAWMEIYEHSKPEFRYGDYFGGSKRVSGSIRGRYVTISVPQPDTTKLNYATFFGEGFAHSHEYAPDLHDGDKETYTPFR